MTPLAIVSGSQFRMDRPEMFDLTSDTYTRDNDEVRRVGRCNARVTGDRTAERFGIARYRAAGGANRNATARVILARRPRRTARLSYLATPPYPDFTCGLTTGTGAAVEVLRRWFRTDDLAWTRTVTSPTPPPSMTIERNFTSLSQAAAESVDARVFGGMHFRTGCVHGVRQGEKVGRFVIQHWLKPLRTRGCAKVCAVGAAVCPSCTDVRSPDES